MKIYGWIIHTTPDAFCAVTSLTEEGALAKLADWCRVDRPPEMRLLDDNHDAVETYFDVSDDYAESFEDDLAMDVNDLREAYCAAIDAGHTLSGDHDWINEQMAALNDALPSEWYVHSSAELDEIANPYSLPIPLGGIDVFPHLPD